MIRQLRESLLSIIPAKDSADITSNPSIITIYQMARIQLSRAVQCERGRERKRKKGIREGERGRKGKKETAVTRADGIDKYRVTH